MASEDVFGKIVADSRARRELLWLRAKEKGCEGDARSLERVDPQIQMRLRAAGFDIEDRAGESERARRERFGRVSVECYDRHAEFFARLSPTPRR